MERVYGKLKKIWCHLPGCNHRKPLVTALFGACTNTRHLAFLSLPTTTMQGPTAATSLAVVFLVLAVLSSSGAPTPAPHGNQRPLVDCQDLLIHFATNLEANKNDWKAASLATCHNISVSSPLDSSCVANCWSKPCTISCPTGKGAYCWCYGANGICECK